MDSTIPTPSPICTAFWDAEYTQSSPPLYAPASVEGDITEHSVYMEVPLHKILKFTPHFGM